MRFRPGVTRLLVVFSLLMIAASAPALSQQVISDDGFASIPWYSTAEDVEAVWGEPLVNRRGVTSAMDLLLYRGLPFDEELTFTVFVLHDSQELWAGVLMTLVADSATAESMMSRWESMASRARGEPACRADDSGPTWPVDKSASWCGIDSPGCSCQDASLSVFAFYLPEQGHGIVSLLSGSPSLVDQGSMAGTLLAGELIPMVADYLGSKNGQ
jgi:hypothetical protein